VWQIWSEEAAELYSEEEEHALFSNVSDMLSHSNKTHVALNYFKRVGLAGNWTNVRAIVSCFIYDIYVICDIDVMSDSLIRIREMTR